MARKVNRHITVGDEEHGHVELSPGDELPSWVDEKDLKEEYFEDDDTPVAAGMRLVDDNSWNELCRAAERIGLEYKKSWSKDQLAQAIRYFLFAEERVDDPDDERDEVDMSGLEKQFDAFNAEGNVAAPDLSESKSTKPKTSTSSTSTGGTGGSHS